MTFELLFWIIAVAVLGIVIVRLLQEDVGR
jgi:preprotein translocase subunit SecG